MDRKAKILIVEDDPLQRQVIVMVLQSQEDIEVADAESAEAAKKCLSDFLPDIIVSDNYMEGESGVEFCRLVKSRPEWRNIMFMLLTAEKDIAHKIKAYDLGADDYLNKPYNSDELLSRIRVLLRLKKLQDDLAHESNELRSTIEMLNQNFEGVVNLLTKLITFRIPNVSARGADAARMCRWMAERLEVDREKMVSIDIAARFHEIGKVTLSDELLQQKYYEMSSEQKRRVVESTLFGEMLVSGIQQFDPMGKWLRHQMENYDGSGYPDKLREEQIMIESRLLRAINFLEELPPAVVADSAALGEVLQKARNTILDPRIVQLMQEYILLNTHPSWIEGKKQVSVLDLKEGMVLAADLSTGTGKKLLPKETKISRTILERIMSQHHYDPIIAGIYIYTEPEANA
jgi:response regulator RpfG family c-di-GMP phosphodiesterase